MPRAGLSTERVVERAAQIVDADGLEVLSLSRLAADLESHPEPVQARLQVMSDLVPAGLRAGSGGARRLPGGLRYGESWT